MTPKFSPPTSDAIKLTALQFDSVQGALSNLPEGTANWLRTTGFDGGVGSCAIIPNADGTMKEAFIGLGAKGQTRARFTAAAGAAKLPQGTYSLQTDLTGAALDEAALGLLKA